MSNLFFTSDLHLGHSNIITYTNRPFSSVEEMDEALVANINNTVGVNDTLYILGDVSYRARKSDILELLRNIKCRNLHLIKGNHDRDWSNDGLFKSIADYAEVKYDTNALPVVLFHYPIESWNRRYHGALHLHGHIHSEGNDRNMRNFINGKYAYDVGVDANNYAPVCLEEILALK